MVKFVANVLYVNCNTFVNALQFLKVDEKFTANVFKSNKLDGTLTNDVHALKQELNIVANVFALNKPDGTVVIVVTESKQDVKIVAFGEYANISDGIEVIFVLLKKDANVVTSLNPVYPPTPLKDALPGIAVKLLHP